MFAVFVYAIITLIGVLHHEIWVDEVQVWMLCRNLSLIELFHQLHNDGHPIFFYLLVMPFAKLFSDIMYMKIICWFSMCLAVFLLFYFSPFKWYCKAAITLSAGFFYFLPVIARSYSILPFLVFLCAILYLKQKEHPVLYALILFVITSTHVIMFCFCSVLLALFVYDNIYLNIKNKTKIRNYVISALIAVCGLLYVIWQLHDTLFVNSCFPDYYDVLQYSIIKTFMNFFVNNYDNTIISIRKTISIADIIFIITTIIIWLILWLNLFKNSKRAFLTAFFGIAFQLGIYIYCYHTYIYVTRIFMAHTIMLFAFWIMLSQKEYQNDAKISQTIFTKKSVNILITIFFLLTSYNGIKCYYLDLNKDYSPTVEAYSYIKNNIKESDIILSDIELYSIGILYYMDKNKDKYKIYYTYRRSDNVKYITWDFMTLFLNTNNVWKIFVEDVKKHHNKDKDIYVMLHVNQKLDESYPDSFKLVFKPSDTIVKNEDIFIYKYIKE